MPAGILRVAHDDGARETKLIASYQDLSADSSNFDRS
jgi:hypothetical protein